MPVTRAMVETHLGEFLAVARRWQRGAERGEASGGLPCPVARIPLQWTEFFALPVAVDAAARRADPEDAALALGLVDFLARVQRPDGTFDSGFCGDLCQPCNAAFALRPLATALRDWPGGLDGARREALAGVLRRAAGACADGGMTTANHRWVAAGGLAHAAEALSDDALGRAADDWTRGTIDVDADGAYSEGSPKYAVVSNDFFLDLEALRGRRDLGELARRSLGYLRAVQLPDGEFAVVGSSRYDTEGSTDGLARAACVFDRLGDRESAARALDRLWEARSAPGLVVPCGIPPLGGVVKAKLYPSVVSALTAEHLLRWLRLEVPDASAGPPPRDAWTPLRASGLALYRSGELALALGRGANLLELQCGGAALEGARVLGHATGWNQLHAVSQDISEDGVRMALHAAPGSDVVRLPQFHRDAPEERRPGNAVPAIRGALELRAGPGSQVALELRIDGPPGANALLELAARPDQAVFDADGVRVRAPFAAPASGRITLGGPGPQRLVLEHEGGSGHALQVAPYGYGAGDAPWSPSFAPACVRIGLAVPARLRLRIRAA